MRRRIVLSHKSRRSRMFARATSSCSERRRSGRCEWRSNRRERGDAATDAVGGEIEPQGNIAPMKNGSRPWDATKEAARPDKCVSAAVVRAAPSCGPSRRAAHEQVNREPQALSHAFPLIAAFPL